MSCCSDIENVKSLDKQSQLEFWRSTEAANKLHTFLFCLISKEIVDSSSSQKHVEE